MPALTESVVEDAALAWVNEFGYAVRPGPEIAADGPKLITSELWVRDAERFIGREA